MFVCFSIQISAYKVGGHIRCTKLVQSPKQTASPKILPNNNNNVFYDP